jgi:hypothetical protein
MPIRILAGIISVLLYDLRFRRKMLREGKDLLLLASLVGKRAAEHGWYVDFELSDLQHTFLQDRWAACLENAPCTFAGVTRSHKMEEMVFGVSDASFRVNPAVSKAAWFELHLLDPTLDRPRHGVYVRDTLGVSFVRLCHVV